MKQEKINRAFPSLTKLKDLSMPVKKAREIYRMYVEMESAYNFALSEERKYLSEYHGTVSNDGVIHFETPDACSAFQAKFDALVSSDIEFSIEPVVLTEDDIGGQILTPGDIYNLDGFVVFE